MRRVLDTWDGHLAHPSLPATLAPEMRSVGYQDANYVPGSVGEVEAEEWAAEQRELGDA
jgi:hypothetical protein